MDGLTLANVVGSFPSPYIVVGSVIFFGLHGALITFSTMRAEPYDHRPFSRHAPVSLSVSSTTLLVFQFWFNSVGCIAGWIALLLLWNEPFGLYNWRHLVLGVVAFSGVTGNLPYLSSGLRGALVGIGNRVRGGI